jgi:hypothetical protein
MENEELVDPISTTIAEVVQPRASAAQSYKELKWLGDFLVSR